MSETPSQVLPDAGDASAEEDLVVVHLLEVPLRLWARTAAHSNDLMREFALLSFGGPSVDPPPARFLQVLEALKERYAGVSNQREVELEAALQAGERTRDWRYDVPRRTGADVAQLIDLLDEADAWCERGSGMMTLPSPTDQRLFRHWFRQQFWSQIEEGAAPVPWTGPLD